MSLHLKGSSYHYVSYLPFSDSPLAEVMSVQAKPAPEHDLIRELGILITESLVLPTDPGTYHVIFNNGFSILTPKAVESKLVLGHVK